ncbi:MAG: Cell division protein FtsA [Lentisphaerae bacterium ADurb.BinA184]|nr:MAG: Cell division protein FtsA [Lentisphaerae bacterium ADurb.BinA184]
MARRKRKILTGVEIGSGTVKVVMGEFEANDLLAIVGVGEFPSIKVVKGEIIDADIVREQLMQALRAAERASGTEIDRIFLAVTGGSIRSENNPGWTAITRPDRRVLEEDLITAHTNAKAYALPPDKRVLHHLDRRYLLDGNREVTNPIGLVGGRLDAEIHVIYGQHNNIETVCRMLNDVMGYPAADIAFSGLASGFAVLPPEEMEKGVLVIDLGAGVTEYVLFYGAGVCHSGQVTVGCDHLANDLSLGLRLPIPRCRQVLTRLESLGASAEMTPDGRSRPLVVEAIGRTARSIPLSSVEQIIDLRLSELFHVILEDLRRHKVLSRIATGVVLCGGGALVHGVQRLARRVFDMNIVVGTPWRTAGNPGVAASPRYATPVGLIRWGRLSMAIADSEPSVIEQTWRELRRGMGTVGRALKW